MMRNLIIIVVLIVAASARAQEYKLGKVTLAELREKTHPADTSAAAAVLFKKTNVFFEKPFLIQ